MKKSVLGKLIAVIMTVALVLSLMMPVASNALIYSDEHSYCWYIDDESDVGGIYEGYNSNGMAALADQIDGIDVMSCVLTGGDPYMHFALGDTDISRCNYAVLYAYYKTENVDCYEEYAVGSFRILASGDGKNFWTMNWGMKYKANEWVKYIVDLSDPTNPDMKFYDNNGKGWDWNECYYEGMHIDGIRITYINDGLSNDSRCYGDSVNVKCVAFFDTMEAAEAFYPFADYTAVDAAIASVPEDLSVYNATTKTAVESAVKNVVRNLSPYDQKVVDLFAEKINTAVAALSSEPDPTEAPAATDAPEEATTVPAEPTKAPQNKDDGNKAEKKGGLGTGAIIGIILAAAVVIAVVVVIIVKRKK